MQSEKQYDEKPHCYAILTAEVRYDKNLSSTAKLLYADIASLTHQTGYCFATNAYLAHLLDLSERQVISCIKKLEEQGHIIVKKTENSRHIYITHSLPDSGDKNVREGDKNVTGRVKKTSQGGEENFTWWGEENFTHNNKIYNNKYNNYKKGSIWEDNINHEELEKLVWDNLGK